MCLLAVIALSSCATTRQKDFSQYDFSLKDTLSIFLLKNEKGYYFCIPIQYEGDYQISRFEYDQGDILIGNYEIPLKREEINITVYLNEKAGEDSYLIDDFNLIYQEENGGILLSKIKDASGSIKNYYYIFIEKYLTDKDMGNILNEYEKRNVNSKFSVWYDLTIDNEEQNGSGLLDDFELFDGPALDSVWFPQNLDFFKAKYLLK